MNYFHTYSRTAMIVAGALVAAAAHAGSLYLGPISPTLGDGTAYGTGGTNSIYYAGLVQESYNNGSTFLAYCTDLDVNAYIGSTWSATLENTTDYHATNTPSPLDPVTGEKIAWLVDNYGLAGDADNHAAVQLAIWAMNPNDGTAVFNGWDSTVSGLAQNYYTLAEANKGTNEDPFLAAAFNGNVQVSQDFILPISERPSVQPTPEPVTVALAIGGLGLAVRRRQARNG